MRRASLLLALLAAMPAQGRAAAPSEPAHGHPGPLFQIRVEPEMNRAFVYRAYLPDGADPASLIVERADGWLGDRGRVDLTPAACPGLREAVMRLGRLALPAVALADNRPDHRGRPYPETYHFAGFVRFPNGAEGEVTFHGWDDGGRQADPLLEWMRGLVRTFDACRPRTDEGR